MPDLRTKVYLNEAEQQADEFEAATHGWSVVTREYLRDGTLRVTYQRAQPTMSPAASMPGHRRGVRAVVDPIVRIAAFSVALVGGIALIGDRWPGDGRSSTLSVCEPASDGLMARLREGLAEDAGWTIRDGVTTRSADFGRLFFVAAEVDGDGLEGNGDIAIWATRDASGRGPIHTVGALSREVSTWPRGESAAGYSRFDDGYDRVAACAGEAEGPRPSG